MNCARACSWTSTMPGVRSLSSFSMRARSSRERGSRHCRCRKPWFRCGMPPRVRAWRRPPSVNRSAMLGS